MSSNQCGRLEIDVLVTAVEASLWIGEQFASDLATLFPKLRVVPYSANKVVGVFSNFQVHLPAASVVGRFRRAVDPRNSGTLPSKRYPQTVEHVGWML